MLGVLYGPVCAADCQLRAVLVTQPCVSRKGGPRARVDECLLYSFCNRDAFFMQLLNYSSYKQTDSEKDSCLIYRSFKLVDSGTCTDRH